MKRSRIGGSLLFLAFSVGVVPAFAQAPAPADPAAAPPPPAEPKWYEPVAGPFKIEGSAGSLKLGVLFQPQFESIGSPNPALDGMSNNLYVRRTRVLLGATLFTNLDFFFETDFANLFKANAEGQKQTPVNFIQDAFFTYKFLGDQLKVDVGYMLTPNAHNALQSAASLLGWDYFANSFRHSDAFNASAGPAGRDAGLELRGLVANGLLEYRAGLFQGLREPATMTDVQANNFFRVAARLQLNLLDPETGFFYGGTYLGAKKILSLGASFDFQDDYKYFAGDGLLDLPLGPGVLTAQVNVVQLDGGDFLALPKQLAIMGEAGFTFVPVGIAPVVRFEQRSFDDEASGPDETRISGGLAYFAHGHNFNVKAFFTNIKPDPGDAYNAINIQAQVYAF